MCPLFLALKVFMSILWFSGTVWRLSWSSLAQVMFELHQIRALKCFLSRLAVVFAQSIEAMRMKPEWRCSIRAAPTGDAPTTPSDQQVYYLLRRDLHKRFDGIRDPYFVMAKLAVDFLPNGARPSADNNADNRVRQVPLTIMFSIHPSFTRWRHSKWSARSREISELFANLCSSMYCQQSWKTAMLHS